jgi:FimV-like protein
MIVLVLCLLIGPVSALHAVSTEAELYSEAESRYLGKNYAAALEAYDGFLRAHPLSERAADVQYRRGVCLYRLERYGEAVAQLDEVARRFGSTRYIAYVPLWKGLALYNLQSFSLAVASLDEFLSREKDAELSPQALLHKSLALQALGADADARVALESLRTGYPGSSLYPTAVVMLGSLLQKAKAFDELGRLVEGTDSSGFPQPWADRFLLLRAEWMSETGRGAEAAELYRRLGTSENEVSLVAYRRLFAAAQGKGDLQEMRTLTQAAEERFAGQAAVLAELWTRVGAESFRQGNRDAAELFLQRVWNVRQSQPVSEVVPVYLAEISLDRDEPQAARGLLEQYVSEGEVGTGAAIIRLGDIALRTGDFAAAEVHYRRFLEAVPGSRRAAEAEYLLAFCAYKLGHFAEATELVEGCLRKPVDAELRQQALKLRIVLLKRGRKVTEAASALEEYVRQYPQDLRSALDLLRLSFTLKQYDRIIEETTAELARFPQMAKSDPYAFLIVSYFRGLSLVARKDYRSAVGDLRAVQASEAQAAGLAVIYPYARYYLGWAYVRTAAFDKAAAVFDELATAFPGHELAPMVLYLAGWSHFSAGAYDRASGYFSTLAKGTGPVELSQKSLYLYAKSLLNAGRRREATEVLQAIVEASPVSPYADDALFDSAGILDEAGQARQAADAYKRLVDGFPESPLREEASYRRAETSFMHGLFADARASFSDYRQKFPTGTLVDAALYWGGSAAFSAGEGFGAVLFWEQLIEGYRASSFRPAAMQKTAEIYAEARNLPKALDLYTRFLTEYPDEARSAKADIRAEQLRYQSLGLSDKEAELTTRIARQTGAARREARLELARLYIFSGEAKAETGRQLLEAVIKEGEPESSARAQVLLGEHFYRRGDLAEASRELLAAAVTASAPGLGERGAELAASSIYRAAEMATLAGKPEDVAALARRLADRFPASPWTAKARKLVEGAR